MLCELDLNKAVIKTNKQKEQLVARRRGTAWQPRLLLLESKHAALLWPLMAASQAPGLPGLCSISNSQPRPRIRSPLQCHSLGGKGLLSSTFLHFGPNPKCDCSGLLILAVTKMERACRQQLQPSVSSRERRKLRGKAGAQSAPVEPWARGQDRALPWSPLCAARSWDSACPPA